MKRNISISRDGNGNSVVIIHDVIFTNKQNIPWDDVEKYLAGYVGEIYKVLDTGDCIYIGSDLPDEYANSKYSAHIKGTRAKAKANAIQGLPEIIEHATGKRYKENLNTKHAKDAKFGWYRYNVRFALPIYENENPTGTYNIFKAELLVRHAQSGRKYLYDMINIKKINKTGTEHSA